VLLLGVDPRPPRSPRPSSQPTGITRGGRPWRPPGAQRRSRTPRPPGRSLEREAHPLEVVVRDRCAQGRREIRPGPHELGEHVHVRSLVAAHVAHVRRALTVDGVRDRLAPRSNASSRSPISGVVFISSAHGAALPTAGTRQSTQRGARPTDSSPGRVG
jgi:hypothetical protein